MNELIALSHITARRQLLQTWFSDTRDFHPRALDAAARQRSSARRVRKVTADGIIATVAGNGTRGFSGDGGPATSAQLCYPLSMAVDREGNVFVGDSSCLSLGFGQANFGNRIRRVSPDGIIRTIAGNGKTGFAGDGGLATEAELTDPTGIAADDDGNLFIAQKGGIRKVSPDGIITTVLDTGISSADCVASVSGLAHGYCFVNTVAVDRVGSVFFTEYGGHDAFDENTYRAILKISRAGIITTVVGNSTPGYEGDSGPAIGAQTSYVSSIGVDDAGELVPR